MYPTIPDSPVAIGVADLARAAAPVYLLNHSYRTYLFGAAVAKQDIDEEAAFVASMVHDLGLTDKHRGASDFAEVSAEVAARFLEQLLWDPDRIRLVEKAIIRHTALVPETDPTVRVVQAGAEIDVTGYGVERVPRDAVAQILFNYPRSDFVSNMKRDYLAEVERHPHGSFATLEEKVQLSQRFATSLAGGYE